MSQQTLMRRVGWARIGQRRTPLYLTIAAVVCHRCGWAIPPFTFIIFRGTRATPRAHPGPCCYWCAPFTLDGDTRREYVTRE